MTGTTTWQDIITALTRCPAPVGATKPGSHGIGIITFRLSTDGVSHVIAQYVQALRGRPDRGRAAYSRIVTITGPGTPPTRLDLGDHHRQIEGLGLYNPVAAALHEPLPQCGDADLPQRILAEAERIAAALGRILDDDDIGQLVVVNVNSLPHNVCASIAVVLAAERRTLPVLNVCHNGYWEHGEGARAALLANCHRRDLFAVVRAVSPWHSPRWYHAAPTRAGARRIPVAPGRPTPAGIVGNAAADCLLRCGEPGVTRAAVMSLEARLPAASPESFDWIRGARIVHPDHQQPGGARPFVALLPVRITRGKRIDRAIVVVHRLMADQATRNALLDRRRVVVVCAGPPDERGADHSHLTAATRAIAAVHTDASIPRPLRESFSVLLPFGVPSALSTAGPPTIRDLYADADLVLSTSERESYGLPIVEAATSGTPVLCVPYAASNRDVHDEVTANLVVGELPADPTADGWVGGIGRWLLDPTLRPATTRHNRRMVAGSHSSVRLAADLDRCLAAIHGAGM